VRADAQSIQLAVLIDLPRWRIGDGLTDNF
jgi:hypothetical protein